MEVERFLFDQLLVEGHTHHAADIVEDRERGNGASPDPGTEMTP